VIIIAFSVHSVHVIIIIRIITKIVNNEYIFRLFVRLIINQRSRLERISKISTFYFPMQLLSISLVHRIDSVFGNNH